MKLPHFDLITCKDPTSTTATLRGPVGWDFHRTKEEAGEKSANGVKLQVWALCLAAGIKDKAAESRCDCMTRRRPSYMAKWMGQ